MKLITRIQNAAFINNRGFWFLLFWQIAYKQNNAWLVKTLHHIVIAAHQHYYSHTDLLTTQVITQADKARGQQPRQNAIVEQMINSKSFV